MRTARIPWQALLLLCVLLTTQHLLPAAPSNSPALREEGFSKGWWERLKPAGNSPTEQLKYADELRERGRLRRACKEYRALVFSYPFSAEAPVAQFNRADCLERRGLYEDAYGAYQFLIDTYQGFFSYDYAIERQIAVVRKLADKKRSFLFFEYAVPEEAIPYIEEMIKNCPHCEGVSGLLFKLAALHEKAGKLVLAAEAYQKYLRMYPSEPLAELASFGYASSHYRLYKKNPNDKDLCANARVAIELFLSSFPRSDSMEQASAWLEELRGIQMSAYFNEALAYEKTASRTGDSRQQLTLLNAAKTVYERLILEQAESKWATVAKARLEAIAQELEKHNEE